MSARQRKRRDKERRRIEKVQRVAQALVPPAGYNLVWHMMDYDRIMGVALTNAANEPVIGVRVHGGRWRHAEDYPAMALANLLERML